MTAFLPSELRTDKQYKAKKKSRQETSNVGKIVDMRKDPNRQIDQDDDHKCGQGCSLQNKMGFGLQTAQK